MNAPNYQEGTPDIVMKAMWNSHGRATSPSVGHVVTTVTGGTRYAFPRKRIGFKMDSQPSLPFD